MKDEYDFSQGVRNPYVGKYIKDGKFTAVVEHNGFSEVVEYDIKTSKKTVLRLIVEDSQIELEDRRIRACE